MNPPFVELQNCLQGHHKRINLRWPDRNKKDLPIEQFAKLLSNEAVKSFIERQEPEILEHFELVVNTVSMEEAVQQQQEVESTTISVTDRAA